MADERRHSKAEEVEVIRDPDELARQESYNVLKQYRKIEEMVSFFLEPEHPFRLRPSHLLVLHRAALEGISPLAGVWRPGGVAIGGSKHNPPDAWQVPERVEELCDYVNEKWAEKSPLHLAAYVMWRLNWIHPFTDGNGRTSRAVSYLVLCIRLKMLPPGRMTIPQQIEQEKTPYYKALEAADDSWTEGKIDLTAMKELMGAMLAKQLHAIYTESDAGESSGGVEEGISIVAAAPSQRSSAERNPLLMKARSGAPGRFIFEISFPDSDVDGASGWTR